MSEEKIKIAFVTKCYFCFMYNQLIFSIPNYDFNINKICELYNINKKKLLVLINMFKIGILKKGMEI